MSSRFYLRTTPQPPTRWTDDGGRRYYLAHLGGSWPSDPTKRMIDSTSPDIAEAKVFDSIEEANTVLAITDNLRNGRWEVVDSEGKVVE